MARLSIRSIGMIATAIFSSLASAVDSVNVAGSDFVNNATGDRLSLIGVAYQPGGQAAFGLGSDPLSNGTVCLRDAVLMQRLGVNTIRIYNLDPSLNHDDCAAIFNAAGIYMLLDVNSPLPGGSIDRTAPWTSYDSDYLTRIFGVVEAFAPYPNTLGFFSGNEVINQDSVVEVPAYIRAVTRDLKDYIAAHVDRPIGVGYSAADVRPMLADTWEYLGCNLANSTSSKIDFFGLNSYSWCGESNFVQSTYNQLVALFSNTSIPVFFSEYGCNFVTPRVFTEVPVIYGPQMTVLSGGMVYEYSQEVSNFGLVVTNDNNTVSLRQDYVNLQKQYDTLDIKLLESQNSTATSQTPPTCDPSVITESTFLNNWAIPARPPGGDELVTNGISNPNRGKVVAVGDTTMNEIVYNVNGSPLTGLKLNTLPDNESNTPGSNDSGSSATTSASGSASATAASPSATSKGAASHNTGSNYAAVLGAAALGAMLL